MLFHFDLEASFISLLREKADPKKNPVEALGVSTAAQLLLAMGDGLCAGGTLGLATRFQPSRYAKAALLDFGLIRVGREAISNATVDDAEIVSMAPVDVLSGDTQYPVRDGQFVIDGEFSYLKYRHIISVRDPDVVFHDSVGGDVSSPADPTHFM